MPKCKNNPFRHYKGTEPSPKGNGWCASGESIGKKRKGTDGKMWIVKKTKTSRRWVPCVACGRTQKKSRKRKHPEKHNTKMMTPLKPNTAQTLHPGYKLQIRIRMPLQYYIDDGYRLVEAPKKTKLTDARILKYLRSAKFRQRITFERMPIETGTLWWQKVLVPKYTPNVDSIHVLVDSHRVFLVTINATLTDKPSETLQHDTMVPFTFKQYQTAIKDSFMWWHKGDILPFKQMGNDPDFLDLHYQEKDICVDSR